MFCTDELAEFCRLSGGWNWTAAAGLRDCCHKEFVLLVCSPLSDGDEGNEGDEGLADGGGNNLGRTCDLRNN